MQKKHQKVGQNSRKHSLKKRFMNHIKPRFQACPPLAGRFSLYLAPYNKQSKAVLISLQFYNFFVLTDFFERFCFDLPDAFTSNAEFLSYFFQGMRDPVIQAETHA